MDYVPGVTSKNDVPAQEEESERSKLPLAKMPGSLY